MARSMTIKRVLTSWVFVVGMAPISVAMAETDAAVRPHAVIPTNDLSSTTQNGAVSSAQKKKSTELSFDEVLVQGKYHFADESVTTVEEDKVLDALLGVRTDFKDRIHQSGSRY